MIKGIKVKVVYDSEINLDEKKIKEIAFNCGILYDTARLLYCRGIDTVEKAKRFLSPSKNGFYDPYLFKNMRAAVNRIARAKERAESVLIFGDYDADGISATTVLYNCLKLFGVNAKTIVPEREEGYGLNVDKIIIKDGNGGTVKPDLVITVDCGISDDEKIETLINGGVDVIVTDHHEPPEKLPNCIIINPKVEDSGYPFAGLCGAGVAYKLGRALIGEAADDYLDFVALATVSDSMELIDENRDIVTEGLKIFNSEKIRPCFITLIGDNAKNITSQTLAFTVAPRINAGGRMGDANSSLRLFLSDSVAEIYEKAELLKSYNVNRQVECENIYNEAKAKLNAEGDLNSIIAVYGDGWNAGFTGIVASRLAEEYSRPVIVFGEVGGALKGSARSVEGVNVYDIISSAKDILTSFGGHAQAAGVGVEKNNFPLLKEKLNDYFEKEYKDFKIEKSVHAEWKVTSPLSLRFIKEIELLEPFGVGNKRPVFGAEIGAVDPLPLKPGGAHYSFSTDVIDMLDFNGEGDVEILSLPIKKTVVFETNRSVYKNRESVKGIAKEIVADFSDLAPLKDYIVSNELDKLTLEESTATSLSLEDFNGKKTGATLYVLSDAENINGVDIPKNLPTFLFNGKFTGDSALLISPRKIPEGYKSVVYLDKPATILKADINAYCNNSVIGYNFINDIKTDRENMAVYYREIISYSKSSIIDPVKFYRKHSFSFGINEFLFAFKVFTELNILKADGNILTVNGIKANLTDSRIYRKVEELKNL